MKRLDDSLNFGKNKTEVNMDKLKVTKGEVKSKEEEQPYYSPLFQKLAYLMSDEAVKNGDVIRMGKGIVVISKISDDGSHEYKGMD